MIAVQQIYENHMLKSSCSLPVTMGALRLQLDCWHKLAFYITLWYRKTPDILHRRSSVRNLTDVLVLNGDPALSGFHHTTAVQSSETEPMVDVVASSVDRPTIFLGVRDAGCLHDDVLDVTPCQVTAVTNSECKMQRHKMD